MTQLVRRLALFSLALLAALPLGAGARHFPGTSWERVRAPEKLGWSREKLRDARYYSATISTADVMVVLDGRVLDEWGDTARKLNVHSIRKSFLSALYGIHVSEGRIRVDLTME